MEESTAVRDAMLRVRDRLSASDVSAFDEIVSQHPATLVGTAPGEWVRERDRLRFGLDRRTMSVPNRTLRHGG